MSIQKITIFVACVFFIFSCKKTTVEPDNIYNYRSYISYTTSGVISKSSDIEIHFTQSIQKWSPDQEIPEEIISLKPAMKGKLLLKNATTLLFKPQTEFDSNQEYSVSVNLDKLFKDVPKEQKSYVFQYKTIKPNFSVSLFELQSYSKDLQYLEGSIKSADVISLNQAKRLIKAEKGTDPVMIVWDESYKKSNVFDFRLDSIQRLENDQEIKISWNGKSINADIDNEESIVIPGKNNFKVTKIDIVNEDQQYISVNFSDPVSNRQNFRGLIAVQNVKQPKFVVDGNVLKVFTNKQLTGTSKVSIYAGVKSASGYKLKQDFSRDLVFEELKPQVRLVNSGSILPSSDNLKFNFEAVNLKAVDVRVIKVFQDNILQFLQYNRLGSKSEVKRVGRRIAKKTIQLIEDPTQNTRTWKAYSVDLSQLFKADPGAIYRVEVDFKREYALYDCKNSSVVNRESYEDHEGLSEDEKEELYWDNKLYRYKNYSYNWRQRNNPCSDSYYNNKAITQNLLGSNIGVIVKRGNLKNYFFAVNDIISTDPMAGVKIGLYNYQQQKFKEITTNSEGIAVYNSDKEAYFAIATKGKNATYLKLTDGNSLSLSKFNVSGVKTQKGIKGFIYAERGVWRPGDSIHLNFILNDNNNKLPLGHPVKLEVTDPNGKLVHKKVVTDHTGQFYSFPFATTKESSTGVYRAKISVGGAKFTKSLKVETVKPNRLKINLSFKDDLFTYNQPMNGSLQLNWLHGAPARNLKAEIKAKIVKTQTTFEGFEKYLFNDPTRNYYSDEITLFDQKVNEDGFASIKQKLNAGKNAPGMLQVNFLVKAFETGGDFSIDAFSKKYAPYSSFVGMQSPKEDDYGSYPTKTNHQFDVVTVTAQGTPISRKNVQVKVYKIRWRWWWNSGRDNLSTYNSDSYHQPYKTLSINTDKNGIGKFTLNIPKKDRGRFLIRVIDPSSKHATGRTLYFYDNWWENISSENKEAAKMLIFNSDKKNYQVGETARITFPSAYEGKALISLENGSEVIEHQWINTQQGKTSIDIKITPKMTPNFFVNISLLQPHSKVENDLPIRLYGTIPIKVENPAKKLEPVIAMADAIEPEKEFTIKVSEKNNKTMTYTLAIVEEGLLDLTRFKSPNPYQTFYAKEALGVRTWDVYDDVIGAYSGGIDQVFAIGGDGSSSKGKNRKANRFKPVIKHLGPFTLKAGEHKEHKVTLPNYIGSVRAMVVAGNARVEAYGNAEKSVKVKKPLMVLASLPRKLSPGEKVTLPVTVFATEKNIKNVSLELKLTKGIKVVGSSKSSLQFSKVGEKMAYFSLDVSKANGINKVKVMARSGSKSAAYEVEIDVANPNPITSKVMNRTLTSNGNTTIDFTTFGVSGSNSAIVHVSSMPHIDFERRLNYLIQYPHGCVEQTTSSVFPQLFMNDLFDLSTKKQNEIERNIKDGIQRLSHFQTPNGGLGYWMGESNPNDWGTSYAGHFMMEAEKKGYVLPFSFKKNWVRYQKDAARKWKPKNRGYSGDVSQAYRLYTLALSGNADLGAMNRLREYAGLSNEARWRLSAAYALVGQKQASSELANTATIEFNSVTNRYNYGSVTRNKAMALETMVMLEDKRTFELAKSIAKTLSSKQWLSTQTTAYSLLSMGKMMIRNGGKSVHVRFTMNGKSETLKTTKTGIDKNLFIRNGSNKLQVVNLEKNTVYISLINKGRLPLGNELQQSRGLSVKVNYTLANGSPVDVRTLKQGQEFVANVQVKNLKNKFVQDVALTQLFPSGWEIVNTRFTSFGGGTKSRARYTDIKDDRVNFYFDLSRKGTSRSTKNFQVLLNASYLGTYYLPGVQSEAMYDNDFLVRGKGQWIKVIK